MVGERINGVVLTILYSKVNFYFLAFGLELKVSLKATFDSKLTMVLMFMVSNVLLTHNQELNRHNV